MNAINRVHLFPQIHSLDGSLPSFPVMVRQVLTHGAGSEVVLYNHSFTLPVLTNDLPDGRLRTSILPIRNRDS